MGLSNPRAIFGVHSFSPYNRSNGEYYGILRVLGGSSFSLSGETVPLMGGSARYPWKIEDSTIEAEIGLKTREYPDFLFELFLGKAPTSNSAEAGASVTAIANKYGTSVVAATGIASVGVKSGSEADVKFGRYVVKAATTTTVDVYLASDVDIIRGTDGEYQNDLLKITASALTIATSTPVTIPNFGLELTGGGGTIGMTADDTAEFTARPINSGSMDVVIGAPTDLYPEFGAVLLSKKQGNGEMFEIDCYRCKGIGLPIGLEENAWSEAEVKAKVFYDSAKSGVFGVRTVIPA